MPLIAVVIKSTRPGTKSPIIFLCLKSALVQSSKPDAVHPRMILGAEPCVAAKAQPVNRPLPDLDHHLALRATAFNLRDGGIRVGKGVDAIDDRANVACIDQGGDLLQLRPVR